MIINICGCGPTIRYFNDNINKSIGVNDVTSYTKIPLYGLVVIDHPSSFAIERRNIITSHAKTLEFFSPHKEWIFAYNKIAFNDLIPENCGDLSTLEDRDKMPFSTNSAFVACIIAYHLGADEIVLYGVDYTPDWVTTNNFPLAKTIMHYDNLRHELEHRGVKLYVCSEKSALYPTLPIYKEKSICKHHYTDWDGMSEYSRCKNCGSRVKVN